MRLSETERIRFPILFYFRDIDLGLARSANGNWNAQDVVKDLSR